MQICFNKSKTSVRQASDERQRSSKLAVSRDTGRTSLPHERVDGGVLRADHRAWPGWLKEVASVQREMYGQKTVC